MAKTRLKRLKSTIIKSKKISNKTIQRTPVSVAIGLTTTKKYPVVKHAIKGIRQPGDKIKNV